jgi:uncharacterized membrane protein (DUF441 family)
MNDLWNNLPPQIRTIINVALGALLAWAATDGLKALAEVDAPPLVLALLVGVATAVVRALNPLDAGTPGYGIGAGNPETVDDEPVGDH